MSENREDTEAAFDASVPTYQAKYPQAVVCLFRHRAMLLACHDFPGEQLMPIRT